MNETISPESVGMSSAGLKNIDLAMQAYVDQGKLAGIATLIARHGKIVQSKCYGKLDIAGTKPIQPSSLFRIYSLTKPITSVAALILYEEGLFQLEDPISKWIPEFKNFRVLKQGTRGEIEPGAQAREITFRHLLTHTSGLGLGLTIEPIEDLYREANILSAACTLQCTLPELIQKIAALPLAAQPGATWHYSVAHDVLGYLIAQIAGEPFESFLRDRIFEPLGMQDTDFHVPPEKFDRFGPMYSAPDDNGLSVVDGVTNSPFMRKDAVPAGGGGLISSISDYFRFMLMLANGGELNNVRVLKQSTVTLMTTNQLTGRIFPVRFNDEPWIGMGYGLGVGVQETDEPRFGWNGVSGTAAWFYPRLELIVISMPQALFYGEPSDTLLKMAQEAVLI